ncbi:hypothetical protein LNI95_11855 [Tenacibaculum dicentrarchi]|uniref:hypothetical protein n=1 Tax=Tenacibaculum finnmarkense TaxID=2781243 RepID=UPI001E297AA8|nr:hypothetical protein [Tenacibaculum finnmarkense]MCD8438359.1 hypothetical protein [Tenacibaculum dicentrarchi]WBX67918.1 hypothetical protein PG910_07210 [Tenacibaculum dicentrarchi]WCC46212.1 hypothetical protein PJH08_07325 [Tenacibaculum finnmarkense]
MCNINGEILFCTCIDSDDNLDNLFWTLVKIKEKKADNWMDMTQGRVMIPSIEISNLNQTVILKKLNSKKCFDFNYNPEENDFLIITKKTLNISSYSHLNPYISFEFSKKKWIINHFSDLEIELKEIKKGKINVT